MTSAGAYTILTCNGYVVERRVSTLREAIEACKSTEVAANDTYARVIQQGGRLIGDADGAWPEDHSPADPMLAAMERRFDGY
jgi:hypothetical protein